MSRDLKPPKCRGKLLQAEDSTFEPRQNLLHISRKNHPPDSATTAGLEAEAETEAFLLIFPQEEKTASWEDECFSTDSLGGHRSTQKHAWAKRSLKTERFFRFLWISNLMDEACIQEPQSFSSSVHILSNNSSTLNLINVIPVDSDADKSWCQAAFVCIRISWAMSSSVLFGCRYQVVSDCINMHTHKQLHSQLPISSGLKWKMRSEIKSWKLLLGTYVCLESWDVNRFLFLDQP